MTEELKPSNYQPSNLCKKIFEIMSEVDYLQKDEKIKFNSGSYNVISEEKVTTIVRAQLIKHKLILLPINFASAVRDIGVVQTEKGPMLGASTLTVCKFLFRLCDIESGESLTLEIGGAGSDSQDKGIGKAMTYAYKYLLLKLFLIPTGDDPDKFSNEQLAEKQNIPSFSEAQNPVPTTSQKKTVTIGMIGAVLTEYQMNTNVDINKCRSLFIEPLGGKMLADIKAEKYPDLIRLVQAEYSKLSVMPKVASLKFASDIIEGAKQ